MFKILNDMPKGRRFLIVLTFCWFFISAHIYAAISSGNVPWDVIGLIGMINTVVLLSWGLWWVFKK